MEDDPDTVVYDLSALSMSAAASATVTKLINQSNNQSNLLSQSQIIKQIANPSVNQSISGNLVKQGGKFHTWHRRWCIVKASHLCYTHQSIDPSNNQENSQSHKYSLSMIPLVDCTLSVYQASNQFNRLHVFGLTPSVHQCAITNRSSNHQSIKSSINQSVNQSHCTSEPRLFLFQAASDSDRQEWIDACISQGAKLFDRSLNLSINQSTILSDNVSDEQSIFDQSVVQGFLSGSNKGYFVLLSNRLIHFKSLPRIKLSNSHQIKQSNIQSNNSLSQSISQLNRERPSLAKHTQPTKQSKDESSVNQTINQIINQLKPDHQWFLDQTDTATCSINDPFSIKLSINHSNNQFRKHLTLIAMDANERNLWHRALVVTIAQLNQSINPSMPQLNNQTNNLSNNQMKLRQRAASVSSPSVTQSSDKPNNPYINQSNGSSQSQSNNQSNNQSVRSSHASSVCLGSAAVVPCQPDSHSINQSNIHPAQRSYSMPAHPFSHSINRSSSQAVVILEDDEEDEFNQSSNPSTKPSPDQRRYSINQSINQSIFNYPSDSDEESELSHLIVGDQSINQTIDQTLNLSIHHHLSHNYQFDDSNDQSVKDNQITINPSFDKCDQDMLFLSNPLSIRSNNQSNNLLINMDDELSDQDFEDNAIIKVCPDSMIDQSINPINQPFQIILDQQFQGNLLEFQKSVLQFISEQKHKL